MMSFRVDRVSAIIALLVLVVLGASWLIEAFESHCDACHCDGACTGACACVAYLESGVATIVVSISATETVPVQQRADSISYISIFRPPQLS